VAIVVGSALLGQQIIEFFNISVASLEVGRLAHGHDGHEHAERADRSHQGHAEEENEAEARPASRWCRWRCRC
jgi:hypothetical protein